MCTGSWNLKFNRFFFIFIFEVGTCTGRVALSEKALKMIHQLIFTKLLGELDYGAGTGIGDFNAAGCASRSAPAEPRGSRGALERQKGTTSSAHTHPCRHQGPGAGRDACVRSRRWRRRRRRWL